MNKENFKIESLTNQQIFEQLLYLCLSLSLSLSYTHTHTDTQKHRHIEIDTDIHAQRKREKRKGCESKFYVQSASENLVEKSAFNILENLTKKRRKV